ncbi:MAG: WYL domain-containing protein [Silvibacterium sp.]
MYTRADGQSGLRTVDPLGLVAKGASWYLVARSSDGLRTYRVSRMKALTPLAIPCERPAHFYIAAFWKESTAQLERQRRRYEAILLLDPRAARLISEWCEASPVEGSQEVPQGRLKFRVMFESEEQAHFVALGFGARAQVVSPAALRERIFADASATVAMGA